MTDLSNLSKHQYDEFKANELDSEWVSVKDRLPSKSGWYDCKTDLGEKKICYAWKAKDNIIWDWPDPSQITHWHD